MTSEVNPDYAKALRRERDRLRKWAETRQGAFERSMLHLDAAPPALADDGEPAESAWLSDHGEGARRLYAAVDDTPKPTRKQLVGRAAMRVRRKAPECLPTFWAVIRNETNWKESVWELMKEKALNPTRVKKPRKSRRPQKRRGKKRRSTKQNGSIDNTLKNC